VGVKLVDVVAMVAMVMEVLVVVVVIVIGRGDMKMGRGAVDRVGQDRSKVVAAAVNSGRKLEVAAQAGVVVQVLVRGRGGTGHWGEEDRRGTVSRWGGGGKAGAGGDDGGWGQGCRWQWCRAGIQSRGGWS
jgi:hypothetical protein